MPRMIHRATLMTRLRLPPTHPDFPHPSLLHAICAAAATYTACVNSLPPEALDESVDRHKAMYGTIEGVEDFGLAQAEAGQKSIRMSTQTCMMGPGNMVVEITQASVGFLHPMDKWILTFRLYCPTCTSPKACHCKAGSSQGLRLDCSKH